MEPKPSGDGSCEKGQGKQFLHSTLPVQIEEGGPRALGPVPQAHTIFATSRGWISYNKTRRRRPPPLFFHFKVKSLFSFLF